MTSVRLTRRQQADNSRSSIVRDNGLFNQIETMMTIQKQNENRSVLTDQYSTSQSQSEPMISNTCRIPLIGHPSSSKSVPVYPESITIGPNNSSELCTCSITMRYRSDPTLPLTANNSRRDEIKVFQMMNDGYQWIVFQGFLRMHDSFTFKSRRLTNDRLHLEFEINGSLDTTLSACCEHPYHQGGRIDDGDSSFWIENIKQYTSCAKCQESIELEKTVIPQTQDAKGSTTEQLIQSPIKPSRSSAVDWSADTSLELSESIIDRIRSQTISMKSANNESQLFKDIKDIMQKGLTEVPVKPMIIPPRIIGNVENFTILYIDENENRDVNDLRSIVNYIRVVKDLDTLITFLTESINEKLIVIVPFDQAEKYLSHLQNHNSIQSIYFLTEQKTDLPSWASQCNKTLHSCSTIESICDHLLQTLPNLTSRMISLEITSNESTSDQSFVYYQLLKETMLCEDEESDLKKDMLAFCRLHYTFNGNELDEFEKIFVETNSIQWYTRYCFLTKILARAFCTQEIDLLFKMRYFIQCLHKQIRTIACKKTITVYTVANIDHEKFEDNINGLVIFHSFLSATMQKPIVTQIQSNSAIFSIRIEHEYAATIEQIRSPDCQIDVLVNLDAIFRIISIDKDQNSIPIIHLQSVSQDDNHFQQLTTSLRQNIKQSVVILQLTKLLLETNHFNEADHLTELIYQDKSFHHDGTLLAALSASHQLLANINADNKDFPTSRYQYFKSLRAFLLFLPYDHHLISSTYNNIGSMFYQNDIHEEAIKFHQMALDCQLKASDPSMSAMSRYLSNIGAVYIDQKNYSKALKPLQQAAKILEQTLTKDNQKSLISIYQKIASCFWRLNRTHEALEYYKKILDHQLKLPNPLPHPLSVTYYNLSTAYERLGDFNQAVDCAQKSVDYLKIISENHPELTENQGQLKTVQQKQWLKELLQ